MTEWTDAQRRAIESDARELVCSAAAGSGKTAVLVEGIIRFLNIGAEPRFLSLPSQTPPLPKCVRKYVTG